MTNSHRQISTTVSQLKADLKHFKEMAAAKEASNVGQPTNSSLQSQVSKLDAKIMTLESKVTESNKKQVNESELTKRVAALENKVASINKPDPKTSVKCDCEKRIAQLESGFDPLVQKLNQMCV